MSKVNKIIFSGAKEEIIEKKSRFIAALEPVKSEEEAAELIESIKKKHWDAAHNCYAYVIGDNYEVQRYSDDGEPGGTAGKPMLDVLVMNGIHNAAAVVTRYFGGTLLGTGGLVRAYQKAVAEALEKCVILEKQQGELLAVSTDYNSIGRIQNIIGQMPVYLLDSRYTHEVEMEVAVPENQKESFVHKITEATNGKADITMLKQVSFGIKEKECILL